MIAFQNILFPVDLSESAAKLSAYIKYVADKFGAKVHLLCVVQDLENYEGFFIPHPSLDIFAEELKTGASKKLDHFRAEYMSDIPDVEYDAVLGDPAEEIVKYAKEHDIDLIIMGTHGRKGLDRLVFGSVAEKVVKMSPVPVLTLNPHKI